MQISPYQQEQLEAISMTATHMDTLSPDQIEALKTASHEYLMFRYDVDAFLNTHFASTCTQRCFQSSLSACCSREGIITFFADIVINALFSASDEQKHLLTVLQKPNAGPKCVYLGPQGCLWRIKPIVCLMFLCDSAKVRVFSDNSSAESAWHVLKNREKQFTWPDKKVLFDDLEAFFLNAGYASSLMYLHNSPGLLLVKKRARL
ncbi:MAG: hypothetical protein NTU74_06805 [Deltaproteobacteria bacterium]|jgi:hypothetical protein|nr:hypothetical protein [Deltaproteobacteria bacterium]